MTDPFAVLGLPARRDLTDEDVRAAWRRIAAATHPDRDDGGDQARYSSAAAAYDTLRTGFGRGEALADLGLAGPRHAKHAPGPRHASRAPRITKRTALSVAIVITALLAAATTGWTPATIALLVGAATWLLALHTRRP
jgi:hypothetical protein